MKNKGPWLVVLIGLAIVIAIAWVTTRQIAQVSHVDECMPIEDRLGAGPGGCEPESGDVVPPPPPPAIQEESADTVVIVGPTLVAYFAVTQEEVDAEPDVGEALADFQYYLGGILQGLKACSVAAFVTYDSSVVLLRGGVAEPFTPRAEAASVGYLLLEPSGVTKQFTGVHTDVDVLTFTAEHFRLDEECWHQTEPEPIHSGESAGQHPI